MPNSLEVMARNYYHHSQKEPKSNCNKDSKILYLRPKVECESAAKEISFEW